MEVYLVDADIELTSFIPRKEDDHRDLSQSTKGNFEWPQDRNVDVDVVRARASTQYVYSDHPYFQSFSALCISNVSSNFLINILSNNGYFVDTNIKQYEHKHAGFYKLFFPTTFLDAVDLSTSEYSLFTDGSVMKIHRYSLISSIVKGHSLFRLRHALRNATFVTGDVKRTIEEAELTGFLFSPVWSSETGPFDTRLFSPYLPGGGDRRKANRLIAAKRERARKIVAARPPM